MKDPLNIPSERKLFQSIENYESLRKGTVAVRDSNFDVFQVGDGKIGICHVIIMMPLNEDRWFFENGLSVGLASEHLNTGNGTIVSELNGLDKRCNVKFTFEFIDTQFSDSVAVENLLKVLDREQGKDILPCAFVGTASSSVTLPTSILSGIKNYPQLTPLATSTQLDDKSQYKLLGRLIPSDEGTAMTAILYYVNRLNVRHLAVVHDNDQYGNAYARALQKAARNVPTPFTLELYDMPVQKSYKNFQDAASFLKSTEYRYFFVIFSNSDKDFGPMMEEAYRQQIAGTGIHSWMFSDGGVPTTGKLFDIGSPQHLSILGALQLSVIGGMESENTVFNSLSKSWKDMGQNKDYQSFVASKHPTNTNITLEENIFQSPGWAVPFMYDSMISIGLAACKKDNDETFLDGPSHFQAILNTTFKGTTGNVILDSKTGTRDPTSSTFVMTNFVEQFHGNGKVSFVGIETEIFHNSQWKNMNTPTIFNDNSTNPLPSLPVIDIDYNYIGDGLRGVALSMYSLILFVNLLIIAWIYIYRETPIIRKSQPIFLYLVSFGVLFMTAAMIPMSIDDEIVSLEQCSLCCMLTQWFLGPGFGLAFSALLSKTWRINKIILNPSVIKLKITPKDVMGPLFINLALNFAVLILWTTISPSEWIRKTQTTDKFGRVLSSYGSCTSDYNTFFRILLALPNFSILLLAAFQAYKARDITTELSESHYIMLSLASVLFIVVLAIPVSIIAVSSNPRAVFFSQNVITFMIGMTILLFIFGPKVFRFYEKKARNESNTNAIPNRYLNKSRQFSIRLSKIPKNSPLDKIPRNNSDLSISQDGMRIVHVKQTESGWKKEKSALEARIKELEFQLLVEDDDEHSDKYRDEEDPN